MEPETSILVLSGQQQHFCAQGEENISVLVQKELTLVVA